jgi:hypothetical protein
MPSVSECSGTVQSVMVLVVEAFEVQALAVTWCAPWA